MSIPEAVSQEYVHSIDSEGRALIMNTLIAFVCVHRIQSIDTVSLIEWHGKSNPRTSNLPLQVLQLRDIEVCIPSNVYENLDSPVQFQ